MENERDLHTPLCTLLGCRYPILQAGMGGVARSELVAAVTEAGGYGFLGMVRETPDLIAREIDAVCARTACGTTPRKACGDDPNGHAGGAAALSNLRRVSSVDALAELIKLIVQVLDDVLASIAENSFFAIWLQSPNCSFSASKDRMRWSLRV